MVYVIIKDDVIIFRKTSSQIGWQLNLGQGFGYINSKDIDFENEQEWVNIYCILKPVSSDPGLKYNMEPCRLKLQRTVVGYLLSFPISLK